MNRNRRKDRDAATFEIIDDPEGLAVRVRAANWRELLRISATAMFKSSTQREHSGSREASYMFPVELESPDYETLLVDWLNELISLSQDRSMIFTDFEVLQLDFEATCRLTAMVEGEPMQNPASQRIKSVVPSTVRIEESSRGLMTKIVFEA